MVKITGEYQGDLHCLAAHDPSGSTLITDAPRDNQGRGEAFSPTDLVATALGTCMATTMAIAARQNGLELRGLKFEVIKEMAIEGPRRIKRLTTHVWVPLPKASAPASFLENVAHNCPVHKSLDQSMEKPIVFIGRSRSLRQPSLPQALFVGRNMVWLAQRKPFRKIGNAQFGILLAQ